MELRHLLSSPLEGNDLLDALSAKIRPLPKTVVPSERFMEQTRARLLSLRPVRRQPAPRRAA